MNTPNKHHRRGGSYTFEELEADVARRQAKAKADAEAVAKAKADMAAKAKSDADAKPKADAPKPVAPGGIATPSDTGSKPAAQN